MLAVFFLYSLLLVANTAVAKLRPIPSTLPNFCDVDRYDGIRYMNDILQTRDETSYSKCVKDCYEYENQACRSVSFYSNDGGKSPYWCDFHGSSIGDDMLTETDYDQMNSSTYFDIHGCGATSCGQRYETDYYWLEILNNHVVTKGPARALYKASWLALVAVHGGDAARFCTAAFISVNDTSYETDMLVTTSSCVTETSGFGKPPRLVDFKAIIVYPDVEVFPDDIAQTPLAVKNVIIPTHGVLLNYFQHGTDLALIQLERPVRFSQVGLNPLCSPTQENRDGISESKCLALHFVVPDSGKDAHSLVVVQNAISNKSNDSYFFTHPCTGRKGDDGAVGILHTSDGKISINQCSDHAGGVTICLENNKWVLRRVTPMRVHGEEPRHSYGSLNSYRLIHWIESNKMEMTSVRQIMKKLKEE